MKYEANFNDAYAKLLDEVWEIQNDSEDDNAYENGMRHHHEKYVKLCERFRMGSDNQNGM